MNGGDLDDDRLSVLRRLLYGIDELVQILDGIDVMVRRRGDGVGALGDHARFGDVADDLGPGQVSSDAGLRALSHLYLYRGSGVEIGLVNAEAAGSDLNDCVLAEAVEVLVQTALAGVVEDAELLCGARQALVRVVADGAVAHCREEYRHRKLELGREVGDYPAVGVAAYAGGLAPEEHLCLHRLAQRVYRRVGDLGGVDEQLVPVDREGIGVAHRGEQHAAAGRLFVYLLYRVAAPVCVFAQRAVAFDYLERVGGAEGDTALAVHAFCLVAYHDAVLFVIAVYSAGALLFADAAFGAAFLTAYYLKLREYI